MGTVSYHSKAALGKDCGHVKLAAKLWCCPLLGCLCSPTIWLGSVMPEEVCLLDMPQWSVKKEIIGGIHGQ